MKEIYAKKLLEEAYKTADYFMIKSAVPVLFGGKESISKIELIEKAKDSIAYDAIIKLLNLTA